MVLESLKPTAVGKLRETLCQELSAIERELAQYEAVLAGAPDPSQRDVLEKIHSRRNRRARLLRSRLELLHSARYQEGDSVILARTLKAA